MGDPMSRQASPAEVMAQFFDGLSQDGKAATVRALMASPQSTTSTRVIGVEVLRAFGLPTDRALSASLDMRPRGEVSVLTVRYAVHGDDATRALTEVVKTWRVVPADEGAEEGSPAAASRPPVL